MARLAFIGLGANLGDRAATLRAALSRLRTNPGIQAMEISRWYETAPVGVLEQPAFLNLVAAVWTTLTPEALLAELLRIEADFGRTREVRWGPRTLDLDLLAFAGEQRTTPELTLPHPRALERAFVLVPWRDLLGRPEFAGAMLDGLRARIEAAEVDETGVCEWTPGAGLSDCGRAARGPTEVGPDGPRAARPQRMDRQPEVPLAPEIHALLQGLKSPGVQLGLERMQRLLEGLGHPERATPAVHVAGTNGKGSVAAMVEAMLRRAGWRTGLYTSPHLVRLGERIQVDRVPVSQAQLTECIHEARAVVETLERAGEARPTYFEFMTAVAWLHFRRARCDIAVIEVGMGGRLDATNVVDPLVSVITSIGLDHTEFLGGTRAEIAREKAGIVKPGRPVVMGRVPAEAAKVIREVAATVGAPVVAVEAAQGSEYPTTSLAGDYQRLNAATASRVGKTLGERWRITDEVIADALQTVTWPARWESRVIDGREVVIDAAHNEEGARALDANLTGLRAQSGQRPIVVIGVLGRDRAAALLQVAARHARELHLVVPQQRRACSHEELGALVPASFLGPVYRRALGEVFPAAGRCQVAAPVEVPVVVTGSIYLAGEVLWRLEPERGPFEPELQDF